MQQMIEHLGSDALRTASGRLVIKDIITPSASFPPSEEFLMSDQTFKENVRIPFSGRAKTRTLSYPTGGHPKRPAAKLIYFFETFAAIPNSPPAIPFRRSQFRAERTSSSTSTHCITCVSSALCAER